MAGILQHLRSSTLDKRPNPASMVDGQVAINYASGAPGMFFKNSNGDLVKVGPVHVGSSAPNASPASGGTAGNSIGEQWLDNSGGTYVFKIWDGSAWRSEAGEFVNTTGDTMTGALILPSGTAAAPALGVGSTDNGIYSPGTDKVAVATSGTGRLSIDSSGNIGIAALGQEASYTDYGKAIVFGSSSESSLGIVLRTGSSGTGSIAFADNSGSGGGAQDGLIEYNQTTRALNFHTAGNTSPRLVIDSTGKVGVGTSSPSSLLHVSGTSGTPVIFERTGSNGVFLGLKDNSGNFSYIGNTNGAFSIQTPGSAYSDKLVVTSAGNVLVGTSSARTDFAATPHVQLEGNDFSTSALSITRNTNSVGRPTLFFGKSRGTSNGATNAVASGDGLGTIEFAGADGDELVRAAFIACQVDGTPGNNDMPGRLVFSTTASGSSSPTERLRITSNGYVRLASGSGGIQFNGDTAAANALDDYEEGTFTPVINGTTAVGSGTYSVQTGRYTKIGNRVCFTVRVAWSAHTGTGYMYIGGLPFQVNASEIVAGSVVADNLTVPAGSIMRALVINSSTSINLYSEATGGSSVSLVTLDTNGQIFVTGHYTV